MFGGYRIRFGQWTATQNGQPLVHRKYLLPNRIGCRPSVVGNILQSKRRHRRWQQLNQLSAISGCVCTEHWLYDFGFGVNSQRRKSSDENLLLIWKVCAECEILVKNIETYTLQWMKLILKMLPFFPHNEMEETRCHWDVFNFISAPTECVNLNLKRTCFWFASFGLTDRKLSDFYIFFTGAAIASRNVPRQCHAQTVKQQFFIIIMCDVTVIRAQTLGSIFA